MAIQALTWTYLWEWTNTGSMFTSSFSNTLPTAEQKHKEYLADMAKKREVIKQQASKVSDPVKKANLDLQYKTSLVWDYFKDKAYQWGKDRLSMPDDEIVQKQMKNIKSFPDAETQITDFMKDKLDEKTLFSSLDKQYAKANYLPKLAKTLRWAWFDWEDDISVIKNYLNKSWDKKAKEDLIKIWVLDKDPTVLDRIWNPWTALIDWSNNIRNPIVSWVLQTIWQAVQWGERAFQWILWETEKWLQKVWMVQPIPKQVKWWKKTTVQNVAEVALWTAQAWFTTQFPWISTIFNIASKTKSYWIDNIPKALWRLANKIWTPIELIPWFDKLAPEQQEEIKSYVWWFILWKWTSKIVKWQWVKQTAIQTESAIQNSLWKQYTKLATKNPAIAWVLSFIESKFAPEASIRLQQKRVEWLQKTQEWITSKILQPWEKTKNAPKATVDVFKTEWWNATFETLQKQNKVAKTTKWAELDAEIAIADKITKPTVDTKITEIATILKRKTSWNRSLKWTSEYESTLASIDWLIEKSKTTWLLTSEKQQLKKLLDAEEKSLYNTNWQVQVDATTQKVLKSYRSYLQKDIENSTRNPEKTRQINKDYNSLREANTLLENSVRKLQSSEKAPWKIRETISKFVFFNWLRKRWVKDVWFIERDLPSMVSKLETKQSVKNIIMDNINKTIERLKRK